MRHRKESGEDCSSISSRSYNWWDDSWRNW